MDFEWDPRKATTNLRKHGVSFPEATTVFEDLLSITVPDPDHSREEDRFLTVGQSHRLRPLIVAHTGRGNRIRIISVPRLTKTEREAYEEKSQD